MQKPVTYGQTHGMEKCHQFHIQSFTLMPSLMLQSWLKQKNSNNILELLNLPLSQQAFSQLGQLQLDINVLQVNDNNDH